MHFKHMFGIPPLRKESSTELHKLVDEFNRHVKIIEKLGEPTDKWSSILEYMLCSKLPAETLTHWEDKAASMKKPTYEALIEFLQKRMKTLDSVQMSNSSGEYPVSAPIAGHSSHFSHYSYSTNNSKRCPCCRQDHLLWYCNQFMQLPQSERLQIVRAKRVCYNCLKIDHSIKNCLSNNRCKHCNEAHHSLLHSFDLPNRQQSRARTPEEQQISPPLTSSVSLNHNRAAVEGENRAAHQREVFLLTTIVMIVDAFGNQHPARALLDCASQPNLISKRLAKLMSLPISRLDIDVKGAGCSLTRVRESIYAEIRSRNSQFSCGVTFLLMDDVAAKLPSQHVDTSHWNIPPGLCLADPYFNQTESIDMIIGAEHFYTFFPTSEKIYLANKLPMLINSVFGWLVVGPAIEEATDHQPNPTRVVMISLEERIESFWKTEELHSYEPYSAQERYCEELYRSTTRRNSDGRYIVQMPKHPDFSSRLGESKGQALRRFYSLERRLSRNTQLRGEYHAFMQEYIDLGHMRPVNVAASKGEKIYYLPHHPVVKESSSTTKVRVVFDGSAKTSSGYSLNEALCVGPIVQDQLLDIVLRFRTYYVALVGDIEKMYRQILLHEADRTLVRILFRFSSTSPVAEYELRTVTYGLAPSSFLSARTLLQLAKDEGHNYPLASLAVRNFYVDDFIGGASSVEEARQLRVELSGMMNRGGFPLRKWTSNRLEVLQGLNNSQIGTKSSLQFDADETVKALGVCWEPEHDNLCFALCMKPSKSPSTKRSIWSEIASLFDPLGLIAPVIVFAKIMMQQLWAMSIGWDEAVPKAFELKWKIFYENLNLLSAYRIERYCFALHSDVQLHIFTDASETAYGSCVYARCEDGEGNIKIALLAAKSRVAPLKRASLPRLELCGAVLGAHLYDRVSKAINLSVQSVHFWCDSTITLHWIRAAPNTWKTYVANRVSDIQNTTKGYKWGHVPGQQNPADLVSRGMTVPEFINSSMWRTGPAWLLLPSSEWPSSEPPLPFEVERETRLVAAVCSNADAVNPWFTRWSSYSKLLHIVAYCKRFVSNLRLKARTKHSSDSASIVLTPVQVEEAKTLLVKMAQADSFKNEIQCLQKDQPIKKDSPIKNLNPFLDEQGVLRVGGRLNLAELPFQAKHPALLPKGHPFTRNLVVHFHWKFLHAGGRTLISNIREEFWPLDARRLVKSVTRECFRCVRMAPSIACQRIGQLPASRVTPSRPFSSVGIDYAGPFYLKPVHRRAAACKAYLCVFVCFATKAVHLELVCDLSTSAFLAALRRFIARRGRPCHIYSDNGKNFEGASNEKADLAVLIAEREEDQQVNEFCTSQGITWHFNPPRAPHFGGLWESAVKIAKRHLYRILGASRLSFEDFYTVLTQIEAVMNSRPLLPLSENPDELAALTPGHFLIGTSMQAIPEPNLHDVPINRLEHYWKLQAYVQRIWIHWKREYLQELQRDTVGHDQNNQFTVGGMVILIDELLPTTRWPLARIVATHPGSDGITRVVSVRTTKGTYKRPIAKICLLPLPAAEETGA